jgi:hypothetical protein
MSAKHNPWRDGNLNQLIAAAEAMGAADASKHLTSIRDLRSELDGIDEADVGKRMALFLAVMCEATALMQAMNAETARREAERLSHERQSTKSIAAPAGLWNRLRSHRKTNRTL